MVGNGNLHSREKLDERILELTLRWNEAAERAKTGNDKEKRAEEILRKELEDLYILR